LFINDHVDTPRDRQQPVVCVINFSDFAFFIDQQRHIIQPVLFDKGTVGLGGIPADTQDFDFA
jgi:hypothetical protein